MDKVHGGLLQDDLNQSSYSLTDSNNIENFTHLAAINNHNSSTNPLNVSQLNLEKDSGLDIHVDINESTNLSQNTNLCIDTNALNDILHQVHEVQLEKNMSNQTMPIENVYKEKNTFHDKEMQKMQNLRKRQARLLLVQSFYNIHVTGMHHTSVINFIPEITKNVLNTKINSQTQQDMFDPDIDYFMQNILEINDIHEYDDKIEKCIQSNPESMDLVTFSILRSACHEIKTYKVHHKIIINEYIEISKSFFNNHRQISFINGVLHNIFAANNA